MTQFKIILVRIIMTILCLGSLLAVLFIGLITPAHAYESPYEKIETAAYQLVEDCMERSDYYGTDRQNYDNREHCTKSMMHTMIQTAVSTRLDFMPEIEKMAPEGVEEEPPLRFWVLTGLLITIVCLNVWSVFM